MTRVALCTTVREPAGLADWLRYHRAIGIDHVYLYIDGEDVPSCAWDAACGGWLTVQRSLISATPIRRAQCANVVDAIGLARGRQDWLVHIDGDELLHVPGGDLRAVFPPPGSDVCQLVFRNLEVARTSRRLDDYAFFREERLFKSPAHPARWLSYGNGKAAGNLHLAGLAPDDVHRFRCAAEASAQEVPQTSAVVLHYAFCLYRQWRHKPNIVEERNRLPMSFYERSREVLALGDEVRAQRFFLDAVVCEDSGQALARGEVLRIDGPAAVLADAAAEPPAPAESVARHARAAVRQALHRAARFPTGPAEAGAPACLLLLSGDLTSTALLFHLLEQTGVALHAQYVARRPGSPGEAGRLDRVLAVVEYCLRSCRGFDFVVTTDGATPVAGQSRLWELAFSAARMARAHPEIGWIISGDGGIDGDGLQAARHVVAGCFWGTGRMPDWRLPCTRLPAGLLARSLPAELQALVGVGEVTDIVG